MAEALCRQHVQTLNNTALQDWSIASAGCWAYPGIPATAKAVIAVSKYNADLSNHSSQPTSAELLEHFNLVLCMENDHVDFIKRHFSPRSENLFLFSEMIDEEYEVQDPVGKSQTEYDASAHEINSIIKDGWNKITALSSN